MIHYDTRLTMTRDMTESTFTRSRSVAEPMTSRSNPASRGPGPTFAGFMNDRREERVKDD